MRILNLHIKATLWIDIEENRLETSKWLIERLDVLILIKLILLFAVKDRVHTQLLQLTKRQVLNVNRKSFNVAVFLQSTKFIFRLVVRFSENKILKNTYFLQDNINIKVMIDDGHLVLANLHIQFDHIGTSFKSVVKRVHRILEHLLRLVDAPCGPCSSMSNVQTGLLQLPVARIARLEAHLDHGLGFSSGVGSCDEVLGCKRGRKESATCGCRVRTVPLQTQSGWYSLWA